MGMDNPFGARKRSRIFDIPDGLDELPSSVKPADQSKDEKHSLEVPGSTGQKEHDNFTDAECSREHGLNLDSFPESESDISQSGEELKSNKGARNESDLKEEFERFSKAVDAHAREAQEEAYRLEMKLHKLDTSKKVNISIWANPIVNEIINVMSKQLGEDKGEIVLAAMLLFYRNATRDERRLLHDLGFLLDNLALQNQELAMETSVLEDLAQQAIELEASPFFSTDEFNSHSTSESDQEGGTDA